MFSWSSRVCFVILLSWHCVTAAQEFSGNLTQRTTTDIQIKGAYNLSVYANKQSGQLLVHLKTYEKNVADKFIDVRTGLPWTGDAEVLNRDFSIYGFDSPSKFEPQDDYIRRTMWQLGCVSPVDFCSAIHNAEVLLFATLLKDSGVLRFEIVELRNLFKQLDDWLSGIGEDDGSQLNSRDWNVLELAARNRQRLEHWIDQIRSVDSAKSWLRLEHNLKHGPQLEKRSLGFGMELGSELRAEIELVGLKITLGSLLRSWEVSGYRTQAFEPIVNFLVAINAGEINGVKNNLQNGVTTQTLDLLLNVSMQQQQKLAEQLTHFGLKHKSHTIWAYGEWLNGRDGIHAPWFSKQVAASEPSLQKPSNSKRPPIPLGGIPVSLGTSSDLGLQKHVTNLVTIGNNINHELSLIRALKNELVLLAFNETSGKLNTETGEAAGFAFVARSIGALQDGKFELQVLPNSKASLKLTHGAYRVKVSLSLEHSREEECISGYRCYFSSKKTYAKSQTSVVTFRINNLNHFQDKQICNFGALLPAAGGNYANTLKTIRLAVTGARVDPQ